MPRVTTVDGAEIEYDVAGSGPPLLLVHGNTEDRHLWASVTERLDDFRCIALDLRGHGASSDAASYSPLDMSHDVAAVVAATCGDGERPAVVGHSLGAVVATAFAATGGARAVVNVDQGLRLADAAAAIRPLEAPLRAGPAGQVMLGLGEALGDGLLPEPIRSEVRARHERARTEVLAGTWEAIFTSTDEELTALAEQQLLPNVQVPYLALHGSDPGPGYAEWLQAVMPTAELEVWDGMGHWLHLLDPDRFATRVRSFLASTSTDR